MFHLNLFHINIKILYIYMTIYIKLYAYVYICIYMYAYMCKIVFNIHNINNL